MYSFKYIITILGVLACALYPHSSFALGNFSSNISKDALIIIKRMEYKEGIPNGLLHAISLVETNIGQNDKYLPWPYTIRLNKYKSSKISNVDEVYQLLETLLDVGYSRFDLIVDDKPNYSLSAINVERILQEKHDSKNIVISARSLIKYMKNKKRAENFLKKLLDNNWYDFKIGIMQLSYSQVKSNLSNEYDALNPYENISVMVKQLKKIRKRHEWWESVGQYHSKQPRKAKRYVKNVWAIYQRVYKLKVK